MILSQVCAPLLPAPTAVLEEVEGFGVVAVAVVVVVVAGDAAAAVGGAGEMGRAAAFLLGAIFGIWGVR